MTHSGHFRILLSASVAGFMLCGCGDSDTVNQSPYEAACTGIATAVCNQLVDCQCTDASALADCQAGWKNLCDVAGGLLIAMYPGVKFDQAKADACMADTVAAVAGCNTQAVMPDCLAEFNFVSGVQAQDEYCTSTMECATDLGCDPSIRQCKPLPGNNQDCTYIQSCQTGYYCPSSSSGTRLCAPIVGSNGTCTEDAGCTEGLSCVGGHCMAPHLATENCDDAGPCVKDATCLQNTTDLHYYCVSKLVDGASCTITGSPGNSEECASGWCSATAAGNICVNVGFCGTFGIAGLINGMTN